MTDWWTETVEEVEKSAPLASAPEPAPTTQTDWWQATTKPQAELRAAERPTGRGIIERTELAAPSEVIARASLGVNAKDQIRSYARHFGVPPSYFGVVDGEIVRWVPEENAFAKVVPTIGGQAGVGGKFVAGVSQVAAGIGPALPGVAGTVAGTLAGPTPASIPIAGGAAFLTDWARQALDKVLAGETPDPFAGADYDYYNMAGQGALSAGGQAIAVGVNRWLTRNPMGIEAYDRLNALDQVEKAKWQAIEAEAQKRGVHLTVGQKTGLKSLMVKERAMSHQWPETMDDAMRFRDTLWKQEIPQAYYNELEKTGPVLGREDMIRSFREGAEDVVQQTLRARQEGARAAYGEAYSKFSALDSPKLRDLWHREVMKDANATARKMANARGDLMGPVDAELTQLARELSAAGKMETPKGGIAKGLSLETWDRVKRGLDEVWKQAVNPKTGELTGYGAAVKTMKDELVGELDRLTGGKAGLYAAARLGYGESSEAVDLVLEGGVGVIRRMSGPDRVDMVTRIFGGRGILPEEIARTRKLFIDAGQEQAWNNGIVQHLSQILDDSIKSAGLTGNIPGQIYSRLGRDQLQRDALVAALGKPQARSFEKFLDVVFAASRSLPEGSPTPAALMPQAGTVSRPLKIVGKLLSPESYWKAGDTVIEGLEALREPASRIKLAKYLMSEKGTEELAKFQMLSPTSQKAVIALSQIFANGEIVELGGRTPSDFEAPILHQTPAR